MPLCRETCLAFNLLPLNSSPSLWSGGALAGAAAYASRRLCEGQLFASHLTGLQSQILNPGWEFSVPYPKIQKVGAREISRTF